MSRYSQIPIIKTPGNENRRFVNVKYPQISLDSQDIYLYIAQGDRYDALAYNFYKDPDLWWIINRANPNQDSASLYPAVGSQIRIPAPNRLSSILLQYDILNQTI
jgi:hypothetical protein